MSQANEVEFVPILLRLVSGGWRGTAEELLSAMNKQARDDGWLMTEHSQWPKNARAVTAKLNQIDWPEGGVYLYKDRVKNRKLLVFTNRRRAAIL